MFRSLAFYLRGFNTIGRQAIFAGCALAFCLPGASGAAGAPAQASAVAVGGTSLRIVAFGSSSTQGIGASRPAATYPAQLQAILTRSMPRGSSVEVLNRGIGGEDVDDMIKRIKSDVIASHPDIVIWQTGSNDPMRHVPIERFEIETRDGINAMKAAGLKVILMEPQWCPRLDATGTANQYRDVIRKVAAELNVAVIHRAELMHRWIAEGQMTKTEMLAPDGLHMSDSGYAALARDIAPDILNARPQPVIMREVRAN